MGHLNSNAFEITHICLWTHVALWANAQLWGYQIALDEYVNYKRLQALAICRITRMHLINNKYIFIEKKHLSIIVHDFIFKNRSCKKGLHIDQGSYAILAFTNVGLYCSPTEAPVMKFDFFQTNVIFDLVLVFHYKIHNLFYYINMNMIMHTSVNVNVIFVVREEDRKAV